MGRYGGGPHPERELRPGLRRAARREIRRDRTRHGIVAVTPRRRRAERLGHPRRPRHGRADLPGPDHVHGRRLESCHPCPQRERNIPPGFFFRNPPPNFKKKKKKKKKKS